MKSTKNLSALLIVSAFVLAVLPIMGVSGSRSMAFESSDSSNTWFWKKTHTIQQAFNADEEIVVVEGQVGQQVEPAAWNIFMFGDGGDFDIRANFGDSVPAGAIPIGKTVRIVGEAEDGEVDVHGLQILESLAVEPNATAKGINDNDFVDQDVSLRGQIGNKIAEFDWWNYYQFTDSTGTTTVDLPDEGELTTDLIPQNIICMIYGRAKNSTTPRVDSDYILLSETAPTINVDIKANGQDGPIVVALTDTVSITISLDPLQKAGQLADLWVTVNTPIFPPGKNTWYSYIAPCGWWPGINLEDQAALTTISNQALYNAALPAAGEYIFYFSIDDPDGFPKGPWWGRDSVKVTVQ